MIAPINLAPFVVSDAAATFDRMSIDGRLREADKVHAAALSDFHLAFATVLGSSSLLAQPVEM